MVIRLEAYSLVGDTLVEFKSSNVEHFPRGTIRGCIPPEEVQPSWLDKLIAIEEQRLGDKFEGSNLPKTHKVYDERRKLFGGSREKIFWYPE